LKVILDANFFFIPAKFQIDIFEGLMALLNQRFDPIVLSPTYEELRRIAERGSPETRRQASLALKLAEKCQLVNIEQSPGEQTDDVIVRVAKDWKCPVATNDAELRKKLRMAQVPTIFLRKKAYLDLEGFIP
jgi:rRNA-processing protein FCF1